jgi:hypothetical protein
MIDFGLLQNTRVSAGQQEGGGVACLGVGGRAGAGGGEVASSAKRELRSQDALAFWCSRSSDTNRSLMALVAAAALLAVKSGALSSCLVRATVPGGLAPSADLLDKSPAAQSPQCLPQVRGAQAEKRMQFRSASLPAS